MNNDDKRASLVTAKGELKVGRRESVVPDAEEEKKYRRKLYIRGLILGAIVVVGVIALLLFLGSNAQL